MKAAFYLWKRRLRWVVLLSVILAVAMGIFTYYTIPVRYQAVAEVLMLKSDSESLDALAREAIRWSGYDAIKDDTLTKAEWADVGIRVQRYGNSSILLAKVRAADAETAAAAANALAASLIDVVNKSMNETALKSVVVAGAPENPILFYRERLIAAVFAGAFVLLSLISLLICIKRPKLIRSADAAQAAQLSVLAELPDLSGVLGAFDRYDPAERPALYDFAGYHTHEQLRLISLTLRFRARQDKLKSLAAVSRADDEYRSEVLVMLAQELSRQGSRVLLVDMNWYAPRLGLLLQAKGERDLIHCLASNIPFEQAIVQTRTRNLYFLDQNHGQSMAAQLSASASFSAFLDAMYEKFDFVLFDMPEADLFSDALALSGALHAFLPIIRANRWTPAQVRQWLDPMRELSRSALGLVLTGSNQKQAREHRKLEKTAGV